MTESEGVDEAPLLAVEPDGGASGQREIVAADVEGVEGEGVPGDRGLGAWVPGTAGESGVDAGRDGIG